MNIEEAAAVLKEPSRLDVYLEKMEINPRKGFACPFCGKGKNSPNAAAKNGRIKCFSCGKNGSILDLIAKDYGYDISDRKGFVQTVKKGAEIFSLHIDENQKQSERERYTHTHTHTHIEQPTEADMQPNTQKPTHAAEPVDLRAFFLEAQNHIQETDYPRARNLSPEIVRRFGLGYVKAWKHPKAPGAAPSSPRLIIPTSDYSYTARLVDTEKGVTKDQMKYKKMKVNASEDSRIPLFNLASYAACQKDNRPLYVVEGELDAISIEQAGGRAIALGTVSAISTLVDYIKHHKPAPFLLLALDNEEGVGRQKTDELINLLNNEGLRYKEVSRILYGDQKDANACLVKDDLDFSLTVEKIEDGVGKEELEAYERATLGKSSLEKLITIPKDGQEAIPTGFKSLDNFLDGGLYPGFYVIGAISSLGKTAFTMQVVDQIASGVDVTDIDENGNETHETVRNDVLVFSLEMERAELVGRSVSRASMQIAMERNEAKPVDVAYSYREIASRRIRRIKDRMTGAPAVLAAAINQYGKGAGERVYIIEGMGNITVDFIRSYVQEHIAKTGKKPVVVVDYMQMIAPSNDGGTDKQNMDNAVLELKRISRDFRIPVIAISSFNRGSYKSGATMAAFKESGAIEYTADVCIGLSLNGFEVTDKTTAKQAQDMENALKARVPRLIDVTILKNRNGITGVGTILKYYARYNLFMEGVPKLN